VEIFSASVVIHMHEKSLVCFCAYPYPCLYDSYHGTDSSMQFFRESDIITDLIV